MVPSVTVITNSDVKEICDIHIVTDAIIESVSFLTHIGL